MWLHSIYMVREANDFPERLHNARQIRWIGVQKADLCFINQICQDYLGTVKIRNPERGAWCITSDMQQERLSSLFPGGLFAMNTWQLELH